MISVDPNFRAERGEAPVFLRPASEPGDTSEASGQEDFSFWDLLDAVNPLQHLPGVSMLYRQITGDEIKAPAKLAGGLLYGGPLGLASSALDVGIEELTGSDIGDHVMSLVDDAGPADFAGDGEGRFGRAARAYGSAGPGDQGLGAAFDALDIESP